MWYCDMLVVPLVEFAATYMTPVSIMIIRDGGYVYISF